MNRFSVVLLITAGILFAVLITSYGTSVTHYSDFRTAKQVRKEVHIVGKWVKREEVIDQPENNLFVFYLQDTTGYVEQVYYTKPRPTHFEKLDKVVVIGRYEGDRFVANRMLEKCPSKYTPNGEAIEQEARNPQVSQ